MMQATRYVDFNGPVEVTIFTLDPFRDSHGHDVDPEHVQWQWSVHAPNGIQRAGRARGKARAIRAAEVAAGSTLAEYDACRALHREEAAHVRAE